MWNYRYGRVAFVSGNVSGDNCGSGVLCRNIGSSIDFQDFDGTENPLYAGAEEMPRFFEDMERAGLSPRLTEKIAYGNISRLF